MNTHAQWGYSFLGVTLGVLSLFIAPLLFKCLSKPTLYRFLPWFSCFGSGVILALIFNHNLADTAEMLTFNWKTGSVFLTGIVSSYIISYFFTSDDHCCDLEEICDKCPKEPPTCCTEQQSLELCETQTAMAVQDDQAGGVAIEKNYNYQTVNNRHNIKHWVFSLMFGDIFCNFSDGMLISSAFILCGHSLGWLTTLSVVLHEASHEIGDFALMLSSGISMKKAIWYNWLNALSAYIGWIIINSISYLENAQTIASYMVLYGSGVLTALVLNMLPKFIKHKELNQQRLRILVLVMGMILATLLFTIIPHCEALHEEGLGDHGNGHESDHESETHHGRRRM